MVVLKKSRYMKFEQPISLTEIAEWIGARIVGEKSAAATGINEIHKVESGDLVFVDHPKYYDKCLQSAASFIIINQEVPVPQGKALLIVDQPFQAYCTIVQRTRPFQPNTNIRGENTLIDASSFLFPNVYVGHHVRIGKDCIIHPNVTILDHCIIGDRVVIQPGTVIGSSAFYYNTKKNRPVWYQKMPDCGRVIIESDVEIGASCTIDRGVSHDTIIGAGSKLDNMVHIGHDTVVGPNCLIAAQTGIAGATTLEEGVVLWGQVGVNKTLTIGANAVVMAQSGVPASLEGNKIYFGSPVQDLRIKQRELVWIKRIPELWKKVMGNTPE
jgi:UDP-3-O-[3-hydroxymyristoyl] glucosamine N-acyltransferase